jgi:hypothetical protein
LFEHDCHAYSVGAGSAQANTTKYRLTQLAKLGGYLARTRDPPPGNMVIWRGLQRFNDIALGFTRRELLVGN